ncbi:hypothetical protein D046_8494B, partial [Vibrio parahaemolyticus V-223/04]
SFSNRSLPCSNSRSRSSANKSRIEGL